MMKACKMKGVAGEVGLGLATALLINGMCDSSWELMGKSTSKQQQAEATLQGAQQVGDVGCSVRDQMT